MSSIFSPYAILMILVNIIFTIHWYLISHGLMSERIQYFYGYGKTWKSMRQDDKDTAGTGVTNELFRMASDWTVPKSSFRLFYIAAIAANVICFLLPGLFVAPVRMIFGRDEVTASNHTLYLIIFAMELLQVTRRCYESLVVSIHAPSSRINLFHLILGFGFYAGVALIICNYGFLDAGMTAPPVSLVRVFAGLILFASGSWIQFDSHRILAGLRRRTRPDGKRLIVTYDHMIPYGHLFEHVSNPHYFAEILIYASLLVVTNFDFAFQLLFYYVVITHFVMGEQSHRWYMDTFKGLYPDRCALIPGIY